MIAARAGWFAAYATMAALLALGMLCSRFGPEPIAPAEPAYVRRGGGWEAMQQLACHGGDRALL